MKKFVKLIAALFCPLVMFGCADLDEAGSDSSGGNYGSLYFGSNARFVDVAGISNATVNVYGFGMKKISMSGISVNGGKGEFTIEKIPVGKNRVIEIEGSKADGVSVKILYAVKNIESGVNEIGTIKDGADSAKGKAYLSLYNAGIDISSVSLGSFEGVESAYLFDSEGFAAAYKNNSSVSPAGFIQKPGTVNFTNIQSAAGYSVWIDDPLSGKLSIESDSVSTKELSGVAPGTWNVYANDEKNTTKIGNVTLSSGGSADFSGLIGNALQGKLIIFVKAKSAPTIWAWQIDGLGLSEGVGETWSTQKAMVSVPDGYMNNPDGWFMKDFTAAGKLSGTGTIHFKLNQGEEKDSKLACTFWYDGKDFYDSDPTTAPVLSSDATLKEIKVNGTSIGVSESCEVSSGTEKVSVSAVANSSKAAVSVSPSGEVSVESGKTASFEIIVTAEDGSKKTYSLSVARKAENPNDVTLSSIKVNGVSISAASGTSFSKSLSGAEDSVSVSVTATASSSSAKVTVSPESKTLADGESQEFTITVTNGTASAKYTVTVDYTKNTVSSYYWTNKNGAVGTNKTISTFSDWTEAEKIAQSAAYDDPRTWTGVQEVPYDVYALYAAYDDTNLYLMVELTNIVDRASFMFHDYAASDNAWWNNRDIPLGMLFNTGKGVNATKPTVGTDGKPIWGSIDFSDSNGFDAMFYHSSKFGEFDGTFVGVGTPGYFKTTSEGVFSYDTAYRLSFNSGTKKGTSGISVKYQRQCAVSKNVYYEATPEDNRKTSGQSGKDLLASSNYKSVETNGLDMSYWYTIPLSTLGVDKAYLQSNGIGVRQITTGGGSLMDCVPWDISMVDVAGELYSGADDYSSKEKEDCDDMTSPQARIGHM